MDYNDREELVARIDELEADLAIAWIEGQGKDN